MPTVRVPGTDRVLALVLLAAGLAACEPASITEARNQLRRGGVRTTQLSLPIAQDTFTVVDFLPAGDTVTTAGGLVGVRLDADSVTVNLGGQLQFDAVQLDSLKISTTAPAVTGPAGTMVPYSARQNSLASEPRLQAVDTITAESGTISITVANRLAMQVNFTVTLPGFFGTGGAALAQSGVVGPAPGTGAYTSATVQFNLANVRIHPDSEVALTGTITLTGAAPNPASLNDAIVLSGTGNIVVRRLVGALDPGLTVELDTIPIEDFQELPPATVDFGDFEDAVRSSILNSATAQLTVVNGANVPLDLRSFQLGAVELTGAGDSLPRDGGGNIVFETDGTGTPILLDLVDAGQTTFAVARNATKGIQLAAATLIDRLIHGVLDGRRMAVVATGRASIGDGAFSSINRTDLVRVRFDLTVGLDITLPVGGVTFSRNQVLDGLQLDSTKAGDLATHVVLATAAAKVVNGTPFGVTVSLSLVGDSVGSAVNIFALPLCTGSPSASCRVSLDSVVLNPSTVDAAGLVQTPSTDSVLVSITGANSKVLFGRNLSAGVRIRLVPGTGGGGRGAIRPTDRLIVGARASVEIQSEGTP